MPTTYLQFELPKNIVTSSTGSFLKNWLMKLFERIVTTIIPKANQDFDDKIDKVKLWLVEFDTETGIPQRELGLDMEGKTIVKMPYKDNYGYWTDNHLLLHDFRKRFQVKEIDGKFFEEKWELFF